jgi:hypothetical protein
MDVFAPGVVDAWYQLYLTWYPRKYFELMRLNA